MKRLALTIIALAIAVGAATSWPKQGYSSQSNEGLQALRQIAQAQAQPQPSTAQPAANPNSPSVRVQGNPKSREYYDLLILGIDRRPHQKTGRSDVIMIIHCEPNHITFFSLPRDSLVRVREGLDKVNHAHAYGGVRLTKLTLERFLKFKVDNYVLVDFETFLKTVDVIKLLTDDGRLIGAENFLVSGENLLKWLRFRTLPMGDRRRAQRHQLFMKRVFEYTQQMFVNQTGVFEQCMKGGLKVAESDLTYDHVVELFELYKNFNLENDLERYVLPGYAQSRYMGDNTVSPGAYESGNMPSFSEIDSDPNIPPEEKGKRKAAAQSAWRKSHAQVSYYIPKYDWALTTYINHYRSKGIKMNYVEEDTLRK